MARDLGIGKHFYHRGHYDIPARRKAEIEAKCRIVSTRDIVKIIKGCVTEMAIVSDSELLRKVASRRQTRFELSAIPLTQDKGSIPSSSSN
jgi:hypothetical protein